MKKIIGGCLVLTLVLLGAWNWMYGAYAETQKTAVAKLQAGDGIGAVEAIHAYFATNASYPVRTISYLEVFHKRLRYHEGVGYLMAGDDQTAEEAMKDAAQSSESEIAFRAYYNLAFPALNRNDLEAAKSHLSKALELASSDAAAKDNGRNKRVCMRNSG